jgi:hypothetical protein
VATANAHHLSPEVVVLAKNDRTGHFVDVATRAGDYFQTKSVGRGAAFADYDNDGDMDILVANLGEAPRLLRNDTENTNHWLTVVPLLPDGETVALGSTVTVTAGSTRSVHPVHGVFGYLSASDPRPHFGLGTADQADTVEIRWPNGQTETLEAVAANQILEVVQSAK